MAGFLECSFDVGGIAKASNEFTRFFFVVRLPDEKSHFCGVPRFNLHYHLHGGTRVRPAPTSPVNRSCCIAAGSRSERLRPMNPARSAVNEVGVGAEVAKVMQSQNSGLYELRAKRLWLCKSHFVTICIPVSSGSGPRTRVA